MIAFNLIPDELNEGIRQFSNILKGKDTKIVVNAHRGKKNSINLKNGICEIVYEEKVYFFRALTIILQKYSEENFSIYENKRFKHSGVQLDFSRNGALTVDSVKKFVDYLAAMGMNQLWLYLEDMFEVEEREYFGYLRGRYGKDELKELDDYAFNYGIELIPSIQTLGHLFQYLKWDEAKDVKDTEGELLAESDATYEFIEKMIVSVLAPLRTNKIKLGMDEAHNLGLGTYLKKNGYKNSYEILMTHLKRVYELAEKIGVEAVTSTDMFFANESENHYYYDRNAEISDSILKKIPKNMILDYWHYGEEYGCDDYMLEKHKKFNRKLMFFGGTWTWSGHFPETFYALDCTQLALNACVNHKIEDVVMTVWGDDGQECNHFYSLLTIQYVAEYCYGNEENFKERFEAVLGANADAFIDMSAYQNVFNEGIEYKSFTERFKGKTLFWQDLLLGQAELYLKNYPMSSHYKKYADKFFNYMQRESKWKLHYQYAYNVFKILELKCYIAENIRKAYKENNKNELAIILDILNNELYDFVEKCHIFHKKIWFEYYKPFGWEVLDIRYGGLKSRIITAQERIDSYLKGEIDRIEELEAKILPHSFSPFTPYKRIATTTYVF